jgi:hypothetical protein
VLTPVLTLYARLGLATMFLNNRRKPPLQGRSAAVLRTQLHQPDAIVRLPVPAYRKGLVAGDEIRQREAHCGRVSPALGADPCNSASAHVPQPDVTNRMMSGCPDGAADASPDGHDPLRPNGRGAPTTSQPS